MSKVYSIEYIVGMEKAILKTLAYYDIFNFPLKAWEIHKWLIGSSASLKQVEKKLKKLKEKLMINNQGDYWFLSDKRSLIKDRKARELVSARHLTTAKIVAQIFKIIPWIKLVGVSGSLAMMGSRDKDDIDLFIITGKNRIWITRLLLIFLTSMVGLRRKRREKILSAAGKICINLILEEDNLTQHNKNIYVAHEILQMHVLWQRDDIYSKFLHDNEWTFRYLPNWKSGIKTQKYNSKVKSFGIVNWLEDLAKGLQLKIMNSPSGSERIESGALYFHPEDKGKKILAEYGKRLEKLSLS